MCSETAATSTLPDNANPAVFEALRCGACLTNLGLMQSRLRKLAAELQGRRPPEVDASAILEEVCAETAAEFGLPVSKKLQDIAVTGEVPMFIKAVPSKRVARGGFITDHLKRTCGQIVELSDETVYEQYEDANLINTVCSEETGACRFKALAKVQRAAAAREREAKQEL